MRPSNAASSVIVILIWGAITVRGQTTQPIDRQALVWRHNITMTSFDPLSPLSVGNGEFAFTVDATGLQTFPELYEKFTPLCTQSQWGWHSKPLPDELKGQQLRYTDYDTYGRPVGYMTGSRGQEALFNWTRENPHKLHLGRIALELLTSNGLAAKPEDLKNLRQTLDLWTGTITSSFELEGKPVTVETCCAGDSDAIAVKISSQHVADGLVSASIHFPYGSPARTAADWDHPDAHTTELLDNQSDLVRRLDADRYHVTIHRAPDATIQRVSQHAFKLRASSRSLQFSVAFGSKSAAAVPVVQAFERSAKFWRDFWMRGGAIDLSGSSDPRWRELERRIILSQYLTRVNCAGSLPPQETGLVCNSWYGKFHLEMHWWHVAHFAAWGRQKLLERSLDYYQQILPVAQGIAKRQGYRGARWPKMTDPSGNDSPSPIGPLLIWQQPHPIYYAELCHRAHPDRATLEKWHQVIEESADFMVSFAVRDPSTGKFNLGPPLKTVPEHSEARTSRNPSFELSYWRFGLRVAQQWRERLGQPRNPAWDGVLNNLAPLPTDDGLYLQEELQPDTYTNWSWEHPSLIGALGVLPGDGVDPKVMRPTLEKVMQVWQWDKCWGWDFPMTAMSAARVGRPDLAVDALLIDSIKNKYLPSGHVYQRENLTLYLPGNGGFLSAVAMMAAGWDGAPSIDAPGFPKDGWIVRHEGLRRMP